MEVAGPTASSQALQGARAKHLLAALSEDVALFLEVQESRTVQTGRSPSRAGGIWVTDMTLFSSLAHREGELSSSRAQGCRCSIFQKHLKMLKVASLEHLIVQVTLVRVQKFGNTPGSQQVCKWKSFQIWAVLRVCLAGGCRSGPNTVPECHHCQDGQGGLCTAHCSPGWLAWPLPKDGEAQRQSGFTTI